MKNIFDETNFLSICNRIGLLSSANQRRWGKMNAEQMLVHCTTQLRLALGEIPSEQQGSFMMRTALGKWIAFSNIQWPKGTATPKELNMEKTSLAPIDFEREQKELLRYLNIIRETQQFSPHPFFGKLSRNEWGRLIYKHIDHHLKQFSQ